MEELWLARDENGDLWMYKRKPVKCPYIGFWDLGKNACVLFKLSSNLYPEVKWSDKEPTKVKFVIEK